MRATLIADTIPDLLPSLDRAPGIHVSDVIQDLCISLGYYTESTICSVCGKDIREHGRKRGTNTRYGLYPRRHRYRTIPMGYAQFGLAVEHAFVERMILDNPSRYERLPEMTLDSLHGNLDLWDNWAWCPHEFKATWQSSRHGLSSDKHFFYRLTQLCAYSWMRERITERRINGGTLHVLYVNGNYKPPTPAYRAWDIEWTRRERAKNWDMLLKHAERMRAARKQEKEIS